MKHFLLTLALLGAFGMTQAQRMSLQRAFGKEITIEAVEEAIAAGNNATAEFNMFDGGVTPF